MIGLFLADFDAREQRGLFMQIIGHRRQSRRNDAARVIPRAIHDIKRHRRAKIHNHGRRAEMMRHRNGIGQAVGTNGVRLGIINAYAAQCFGREFQGLQTPPPPGHLANKRRGARNNAAQGSSFQGGATNESHHQFLRLAFEPGRGGDVGLFDDALAVRQPEMGVRVADVEKEDHTKLIIFPSSHRRR